MAKLLFVNGLGQTPSNFIGAGSTSTDLEYLQKDLSTCEQVEITEAQYVGLLTGQKVLNFAEGSVSVLDESEDYDNPTGPDVDPETGEAREKDPIPQVDKESFTTNLNYTIANIKENIEKKPNHSQITKAQECLDYLNGIDVDSLSYPHDDVNVKMFKDNKYINIRYF